MIEFRTGNLFSEDAEALVNAVNCVGVMGRGLALQFKQRFPDNFKAYAHACKHKEVQPGRMFIFQTGESTYPRFIINFPTKRRWREPSRMADIETGLGALAGEIRRRDIRSIAIPALGCGLGGLDWAQVRPRMETALRPLENVRIVVYEPPATPSTDGTKRNRQSPGAASRRPVAG